MGKATSMHYIRMIVVLSIAVIAGCAGTNAQSPKNDDFVEIPNPALTMSPNAPEKIWVPREYVETGVARGNVLLKRGYEAVKGGVSTAAPQPGTAAQAGSAPAAAPQAGIPAQAGSAPVTAAQAGITAQAGKPATFLPHFGLVVRVDGERVYFNLGREAGIVPGQKLKVYRGGTVVEGLGLAPGESVGMVEVLGYVGTMGGYGLVKQGGPVRVNDLIGAE